MIAAWVLAAACASPIRAAKPADDDEGIYWASEASATGPTVAPRSKTDAPASDAPAEGFEVVVQEEPATYPVTGKTQAAILASMGGSGINDGIDGSKGAAATGASLSTKFSRQKGTQGCALTAARLTMKIQQRLPHWDAPQDAPPETWNWWAKYLGVIRLHEDGHKKIDVDSAHDALDYLKRLGPYPTCEALDDAVATETHRANTEGMQKNVAYDAETQHGRTQYAAAFGKP